MKEITIKFVDFWKSFNHGKNVFVDALSAKFKVKVLDGSSKEKPDLLFYSLFGNEHYKYQDTVKIYFSGENDVPDFNECDYALSHNRMDFNGRHLRYPLYMTYEIEDALNPRMIADSQALERGFCSLLMSNSTDCARRRLEIIDAVESYKPIAYGGPYRNNIGGRVPVDGKIEFISHYKFNLALENSALEGYVTEKVVEPFAASTVPIYWGAPDVSEDFNPQAYIDVSDYVNKESFLRDLKEIDTDPERYLSILRAPKLAADSHITFNEQLSDFLCGIVDNPRVRRPSNAMSKVFYRRNRILRTAMGNPKMVNLLGKLLNLSHN